MTAPLFWLPPGATDAVVSGMAVELTGPEGRHAATVKRLAAGEPILLADGSGTRLLGRVTGVGKDAVTVLVEDVLVDPQPSPRLVLVQALAKADRDDQAIEAATELGVDAVIPWQADRSIVQWRGDRGAKAHAKWQSLVAAAAKQARRSRIPVVEPVLTSKQLAQRLGDGQALVLHEEAAQPLAGIELLSSGEVIVVVGPEGGITPDELDRFSEAGAQPVRLGDTVLRSSSAGPAALAVLASRLRWT